MRRVTTTLAFALLIQVSFAGQQSLAEAARKEAERRRALDQQGIEAKVIGAVPAGPAVNAGPVNDSSYPVRREKSGRVRSSKNQPSLHALRTTLQRLDRELQHGEERLALLRSRVESEKWQLPKVGRISRGNSHTSAQERLRFQIQELEAKLKHLRRERYETYESGRKAGFLPGELDGKGITP